jgi:DNA-binding GntR family transcriptional regulator
MRVKRETISQQCIKLLRDDIFERKLLPGTAVTEEAVARDMGVSRATVREVLSTLTAEGLLTRNPTTRSLHVMRLGPDSIREIYRARRFLEVGGITAYTDQCNSALQPLIEATNRLVDAVRAREHLDIVRMDIACHIEIVGLIGSVELVDFYRGLLAKLQLAMAAVATSRQYNLEALLEDHIELIHLLDKREMDKARDHVIDRMTRAEMHLLAATMMPQR